VNIVIENQSTPSSLFTGLTIWIGPHQVWQKKEKLISNEAHVSSSDEMSTIPPELSQREPCRRTQQKMQALRLLCYEGGFTQSWHTVGAGKNPTLRVLNLEERTALQW